MSTSRRLGVVSSPCLALTTLTVQPIRRAAHVGTSEPLTTAPGFRGGWGPISGPSLRAALFEPIVLICDSEGQVTGVHGVFLAGGMFVRTLHRSHERPKTSSGFFAISHVILGILFPGGTTSHDGQYCPRTELPYCSSVIPGGRGLTAVEIEADAPRAGNQGRAAAFA